VNYFTYPAWVILERSETFWAYFEHNKLLPGWLGSSVGRIQHCYHKAVGSIFVQALTC